MRRIQKHLILEAMLIGSYEKKNFFTMATKVKPTIVKIFEKYIRMRNSKK